MFIIPHTDWRRCIKVQLLSRSDFFFHIPEMQSCLFNLGEVIMSGFGGNFTPTILPVSISSIFKTAFSFFPIVSEIVSTKISYSFQHFHSSRYLFHNLTWKVLALVVFLKFDCLKNSFFHAANIHLKMFIFSPSSLIVSSFSKNSATHSICRYLSDNFLYSFCAASISSSLY